MRAARLLGLLTAAALLATATASRVRAGELSWSQRRAVARLLKSSRGKYANSYTVGRKLALYGEGAVPQLVDALGHRDERVRGSARRALQLIGSPAGGAVVEIAGKGNHHARKAAARLLGEFKPRPAGAVEALIKLLEYRDGQVRRAAVYSLAAIGPEAGAAVPALTRCLRDEEPTVVSGAARALGDIGHASTSSADALLAVIGQQKPAARTAVLRALGRIGAPSEKVLPALLKAITDTRHEVRRAAVDGLRALEASPAKTLPALTARLGDRHYLVRRSAIQAIGEMGPGGAPAVKALSVRLSDSLNMTFAMIALGRIGPAAAAAIPGLEEKVADSSEKTHRAALEALAKIRPGYKPPAEVLRKRELRLLAARLGSYSKETRLEAAGKIARMGDYAVPELLRLLSKGSDQTRIMAAYTLELMHGPLSAAREVGVATGDSSSTVGANCALVVIKMGPAGKAAVPGMIEALKTWVPKAYSTSKTGAEREAKRRRLIARALASVGAGAAGAIPALEAAARDKNATVRTAALKAIADIRAAVAQAGNTARLSGKLRKLSEYRDEVRKATGLMQARKLNEAYGIFTSVIKQLEAERELSGYAAAVRALSAAGKDEDARREAMVLVSAANARLGGAEPAGRDPKTGKLVIPMMAQLNGQTKMNYLNRAILSRAGIWYAARKYDSAIADLNRLLGYSSYNRRALFMRAECYERKRDYARAGKDYAAVLAWGQTRDNKPEQLNYMAHLGRARSFARRRKYAEAIADLKDAVAMYPDRTEAYTARVRIWSALHRNDELVRDYTRLLRLSGNKDSKVLVLGSRAGALVKLGRYREAVADYTELIKLSPGKVENYYLRGRARSYMGDRQDALKDLDAALAARPGTRRYLKERGWVHLGLKSYDKGIADFDAVISRPPAGDDAAALSGPAPVPWDAYLGRGQCYQYKKQPARALADFRMAVDRNPNSARALNTLAWMLATHHDAKIRNGKEAVTHAEAAVKVTARREPVYLDTLAAAYAECGRFEDAVRVQKEAIGKLAKHQGKALADELAGHLRAFEAGRPYREPGR